MTNNIILALHQLTSWQAAFAEIEMSMKENSIQIIDIIIFLFFFHYIPHKL